MIRAWQIVATIMCLTISAPAFGYPETAPRSIEQQPQRAANLVLTFSQPVNLRRTSVFIRNSRGQAIEIGTLGLRHGGMEVEIPLATPLPPDAYTIRWHAVSEQGIVDVGGYDFTIDPFVSGIPTVAQQ
jgi:methionine-rich copper-binding protein CopC